MNLVARNFKHSLFCGPTGTGKTISIANEMRLGFDPEEYENLGLAFSAQTSANQTQNIIDGKMEKRRKGVYGPRLGKKGIIFVDDLNMPQKEKYGAQPPVELLRQWMDYRGWYEIDNPDKEFREIQNIKFVCAMSPPGGGRNYITARYVRHFVVCYVEPYKLESLNYIFMNIMDWMFLRNSNPSYSKPVQSLRDSLVSATINIYNNVIAAFKPTPAKSHYTYNLRDVSKVFQGISKGNPKGIRNENEMIKLWAHECQRVFGDRLINNEDRIELDKLLKIMVKDKFKREWEKLVEFEPLLFASFVPTIYPDNDTSKKPINDLYCELTDRAKMNKIANNSLEEYNNYYPSKKMNLVLFLDAIQHIIKIHRIITTPLGNALLVGVGGSGRKSLTELATFIAQFENFAIEITKTYGINDWRDDMKQMMQKSGIEERQIVFLLSDTQISNEVYVEDVNNILNNGEIPNLFSAQEDLQPVLEGMKEVLKGNPILKNISEADLFLLFKERCRQNNHVVLAFSPIGEDFRRRLRMFPALVNCCTIDWFLPWPPQALQTVAENFLSDVELEEREGIVQICVDMQERVTMLSKRYYDELRRYYYVTPTSYLELINTFKTLLGKKRDEIDFVIQKFTKGLEQLANAQKQVNLLQVELTDLEPKLEVAQKETQTMMVDIDKQRKEVAEISKECEKEEATAKAATEEANAIEEDCK